MNLTEVEFNLARHIVDYCLTLDDDKIAAFIEDKTKDFVEKLDKSKLDDREKIYHFLKHQSSLFLNYHLNSNIYLIGEKEKCKIGIHTITKIFVDFSETGL